MHMRQQHTFIKDVLECIERSIICKVYKVVLLFFSAMEKASPWCGAPQLEKDSEQLDRFQRRAKE